MTTLRPVLNQLDLVARGFDATLAFYRRLGLDPTDKSASAGGVRHAEVALPNDLVLEFDNEDVAALPFDNGSMRTPVGNMVQLRLSHLS